jgi:hypothetical protein
VEGGQEFRATVLQMRECTLQKVPSYAKIRSTVSRRSDDGLGDSTNPCDSTNPDRNTNPGCNKKNQCHIVY